MQAFDSGTGVSDGAPLRIPLAKVGEVGIDVSVDVDGEQTRAWDWEKWLRRHVIGRIPGGEARK